MYVCIINFPLERKLLVFKANGVSFQKDFVKLWGVSVDLETKQAREIPMTSGEFAVFKRMIDMDIKSNIEPQREFYVSWNL